MNILPARGGFTEKSFHAAFSQISAPPLFGKNGEKTPLMAHSVFFVTKPARFFHPLFGGCMKKQLAVALFALTAYTAHAQFLGDTRSRQNDAYQQYLACVKKYAESSVGQNALPSDIASAALSACDEHYQRMLLPTYELFGYTQWANDVLAESRQKARDFAIQAVLEARRPR